MDKTTIGIVSAILVAPGAAAAAPTAALPRVGSYAELLEPIPNAPELLKQAMLRDGAAPARLVPAQYYYHDHHHHHHHHHHHWAPYYNPYAYYGYGYYRPYTYYYGRPWGYYHHHHHHHHDDWE